MYINHSIVNPISIKEYYHVIDWNNSIQEPTRLQRSPSIAYDEISFNIWWIFIFKEHRSLKMKIIIFKLRKYNIVRIKQSSFLERTFYFVFYFILERLFVFRNSQVIQMKLFVKFRTKTNIKTTLQTTNLCFGKIVSSAFILLLKIHVKKL